MLQKDTYTTLNPVNRLFIKVAPRVEKTEVFKTGWKFANRACFASCIIKKTLFIMDERKSVFCLILTMKLSSTGLKYLNVHSTLNFAKTFLFFNINTNQTSKEQDLNFIRSSQLFWQQPWRGVLEVNCQACNFTLQASLRILVAFFRPVLKNLLNF